MIRDAAKRNDMTNSDSHVKKRVDSPAFVMALYFFASKRV
jgi:hypothetical protein